MDIEFTVGDEVTVDRYNHIKNAVKTTVRKIVPWHFSETEMAYEFNINGCRIVCRPSSIMESKHYDPVPDDQRHDYVKPYKRYSDEFI